MTDLETIAYGTRPIPTEKELWQARQKRVFVICLTVGLALFVGGLGWMTRPEHDVAPAIVAVVLGLVTILVGAWFGLRAVVGEPQSP